MTVWTSDLPPLPKRPLQQAIARGFRCRCPNCGKGKLFDGYLTVRAACRVCGEDLSHQRADDAPPYFTIVAVGHIIVPLMLFVSMHWLWPDWLHLLVWLPLTLALTLLLLRPIKGATVGLQWGLYMHGFDPRSESESPTAKAWRGDTAGKLPAA